jgi:hypothetical protein
MKIDTQQSLSVFLKAQKETPNYSAGLQTDFASLLNPKTVTPPALELGPDLWPQQDLIGQLQANQAIKSSSSPYTAADDIEKLLDLLDDYSASLADPSKSLKDLAPLADDLGLMAQQLGQTSTKLSSDDPLKALSSDAATVATVEAMKFKRGDYL